MEEFDQRSGTTNAAPSRRDEIQRAAEAILHEERRAALDTKMRQKKMRVLSSNSQAR